MEQKGAITCLEFFGQSHMLSGSADHSICIWRTADWNCLHILGGHKGEVTSMAVHPSGKLAFSVARDRTLRMWNLVKGRIAYIRRLEKEASFVMMSQNGARYALCFGNEVSVFNSAHADVVGSLEHKDKIHCAVFATDEYVVCGGEDKTLYVWKASGTLVAKVQHKDLTSRIRCMQVVYVNGQDELPWIIIASSNGTVQVWDVSSFVMDADAPEESNSSVTPLVSHVLLSKPRVTCLSACLLTSEESDSKVEETLKKPKIKKVKKTLGESKPSTASVAPRVIIEMNDESQPSQKKQKTEKPSTGKNNKRKAASTASHPQKKSK